MRVLHIQKTHGIGGSERHIVDLCAALRARGVAAEILWLAEPGRPLEALSGLCDAAGVPAETWPIRCDLDPALIARLRARLAADPPDLLHAHLIHATLHLALAARGSGRPPWIATRHGAESHRRRPWFGLLMRAVDRACARVIVPSLFLLAFTRRWEGTPLEKLRHIPHGIRLEAFAAAAADAGRRGRLRAAWGVPPQACLIGCIARLHPSKDHPTLLRAFARLARAAPGAHLVLVGDGPRRARLEASAHRLLPATAAARLHFAGEVADSAGAVCACDIAVVVSKAEGFALAALEAQAAGRPLVASRAGALPERVTEGETGLLVPPGDAAALAGALARLIEDPSLRGRLAARARERAQACSLEAMAAATQALYEEVLGERAGRTTGRGRERAR